MVVELHFGGHTKTPEEKMRIYNRKYRQAHSYDVTCRCGSTYKAISKYTHIKSQKHQRFIEEENKKE